MCLSQARQGRSKCLVIKSPHRMVYVWCMFCQNIGKQKKTRHWTLRGIKFKKEGTSRRPPFPKTLTKNKSTVDAPEGDSLMKGRNLTAAPRYTQLIPNTQCQWQKSITPLNMSSVQSVNSCNISMIDFVIKRNIAIFVIPNDTEV